MPHLYKKTFKGRTYWYLRETCRVEGKVKVGWQKYLGSAESIAEKLEQSRKGLTPLKQWSAPFGALFVIDQLEKELDTIGIIDSVIPRAGNEKGPSVGEYFFYAWANRMISPRSKRSLEQWYKKTAIEQIRPVDLSELTSERYWEKWDRISEQDIEKIGALFLERLWKDRRQGLESLLFDTTNYYTYMATKTKSELAVRGHNKSSKHHLRQVGLGLLVDRESELPLYYKLYPGNLHDSKLFHQVMDEIFGVATGIGSPDKDITVVFDKGMNSEDNISFIDSSNRLHFVTTYSTYFAEELAGMDTKYFTPLDIPKNSDCEDQVLAYRTTHHIWGRERTVVVTFNPATKRKKLYDFNRKMDQLRFELLEYRRRYRAKETHWKNPSAIISRYRRLCEDIHINSNCYSLEFTPQEMSFRKSPTWVSNALSLMGKNIIVTDRQSWATEQIVAACLDRSRIEKQFRVSKSSCHVHVNPMFHWTDGKIRCHLLTCIIALAALRLLELRVAQGLTAKTIMEEMHSLNSVLSWYPGSRSPVSRIDDPTPIQSQILASLGYSIQNR
jgi:transposase